MAELNTPAYQRKKKPVMFRFLMVVLSMGMCAVSLYLTKHYYEVHYPLGYYSNTVCDVSGYWNCDTATFSPLSAFYGVPTSVFGFIVGLLLFIGSLWDSSAVLRTNFLMSQANALGCIGLFIYSVLFLGGLCPGCTVYYVLSLFVAGALWFRPGTRALLPDVRVSVIWGIIAATILGYSYHFSREKESGIEKVSSTILSDFQESAVFSGVKLNSSLRLVSATKIFEDAPLRISLFSDFQCPVCKVLAEKILPKLIQHYKGLINLQYIHFPMDHACNHNISQPLHPMACEAAYVASCLPQKFFELHERLYAVQQDLSFTLLQKIANQYGISSCFNDVRTKDLVENMVLDGDKVGVQATPTMLINERKFEGLLPLKYLILLCDEAIRLDMSSD